MGTGRIIDRAVVGVGDMLLTETERESMRGCSIGNGSVSPPPSRVSPQRLASHACVPCAVLSSSLPNPVPLLIRSGLDALGCGGNSIRNVLWFGSWVRFHQQHRHLPIDHIFFYNKQSAGVTSG